MARYLNNSGKIEGRIVYPRAYKWGPGVPSKTVEFVEIPQNKDPFSQFQNLLTTQDGKLLISANNDYLEPNV